MQIYKRYISFSLLMPVIVVTLTITAIIWLSQALKLMDFIVNRGVGVATVIYLSILAIPAFLIIILPIALFVSVLLVYNRLNSESELLVLKGAGISRIGLAMPALLVAGGVTLLNYLISLYILPLSYREFKDMQDFIRDNYASALLQEGVFSTPVERLTVYIESRDSTGILHGILVHDARNSEKPVTFIAQKGSLIQTAAGPKFQLINGNIQTLDRKGGNLSFIYFDSYPFDLGMYSGAGDKRLRTAEERYINDLFFPQEADSRIKNRLRAEGHHRITWPFLSVTMTMIALSVLFSGQLNRRGQWKRILSASLVVLIIVVIDLGLKNLIADKPFLAFLLYINTVLPAIFCLYILMANRNINGINFYKLRRYFGAMPYSAIQR